MGVNGQGFGSVPDPASNLSPHVAAGLAYLFGFVTGIIFFILTPNDGFVRFAAVQSIVLSIAAFLASVVWGVAVTVVAVGVPWAGLLLASAGSSLLGLVFLAAWLVCMVGAFQGKTVRLPLLGAVAARYVHGI
ncbi:MAG: hypothetical protein M0Z53_13200 [Thermaerobacter sp.]|nr:hypothetical protein [Thermaerobacter sp.]